VTGGPIAKLAVDPIDLSELLSILLDNAGKWAASRVEIAWDIAPKTCTVTITDNGPGMNADQIRGSFGIGVRYDVSKPGSGLGLAIAQDIAEAYGIDLHLSAGAGLCASLIVPQA
jgi:signal transduction histidine kinase